MSSLSEIKNHIYYLKAGYVAEMVINTLDDYYFDTGVEPKNEGPDFKNNLIESIALALSELDHR